MHPFQKREGFEHGANLGEIFNAGRHHGSRNTGWSSPISAMPAFTGVGLVSTKLTSSSGSHLRCMARAAAKSPETHNRASSVISAGMMLDATEIIPRPPMAAIGSVSESSPESTMKSSGTCWITCVICAKFPDASFTPMMFSISESRRTVAGSILTLVRGGTFRE